MSTADTPVATAPRPDWVNRILQGLIAALLSWIAANAGQSSAPTTPPKPVPTIQTVVDRLDAIDKKLSHIVPEN